MGVAGRGGGDGVRASGAEVTNGPARAPVVGGRVVVTRHAGGALAVGGGCAFSRYARTLRAQAPGCAGVDARVGLAGATARTGLERAPRA